MNKLGCIAERLRIERGYTVLERSVSKSGEGGRGGRGELKLHSKAASRYSVLALLVFDVTPAASRLLATKRGWLW